MGAGTRSALQMSAGSRAGTESGWLGGRNTNSGHQGTVREGREKEKEEKSQWKRCIQDSPGLSFLCPESCQILREVCASGSCPYTGNCY